MAITVDTIVKLPTSRKILFFVLIMAVILGLYFYLVYLPNSQELEKKTAEMGKLETQIRELRTIAANMKRFQAEAAKLREELNLAIAQLPTSKEIPSLLANVSNLGKEAGLEFLLFRPSPEITRDFYSEIPVEIKVKGTYNEVAIFFDKVGKMPRIVNISGVTMEGAKEVFGRWEITTSCTATTFKFIEKEAVELAKDKAVIGEKKGVPPAKK
ncbi:MAG: type 4a pilus biogenesis protein PilO [Thermodesulfobacteriota bacterium]|nr:type 4a pilus biogenesis protein PilO [Thermodesulfobacteriota bacterium]